MQIYRCELTLLERTFFASREVGNFYQTEPVIGNYALAYAMGWVRAPYFNKGKTYYGEHMGELNDGGVYIMPATLVGRPRFVVEQFNAVPDSYWFAMGNNALITKPDGHDAVKNGSAWYVVNRATGKRTRIRPNNRPQIGRIKMLGIGNKAIFYVVFSGTERRIPRYVRLGKWMSKARIDAKPVGFKRVEASQARMDLLLNPLDLSVGTSIHTFDLLSIHPAPLLRNAILSGEFYQLSGGNAPLLPADMHFGVEILNDDR